MDVCIFDRERAVHEGDDIAVEEVLGNVRRLIGHGRKFCVARDVYSVKDDFSVCSVTKPVAVDAESKRSHGMEGNDRITNAPRQLCSR